MYPLKTFVKSYAFINKENEVSQNLSAGTNGLVILFQLIRRGRKDAKSEASMVFQSYWIDTKC